MPVLLLAAGLAAGTALHAQRTIDILRATGGLPAHVAGRFTDLSNCQQSADGTYFVLDRRAHAVFSVSPDDTVRELVQIGSEEGHVLRPYAFALGGDGSFVVVDAPGGQARAQFFLTSGAAVGRFLLDAGEQPLIVSDAIVLSGLGAIAYNGRSLFVSQPSNGALVTEYGLDGRIVSTFGTLRPTGHERDRPLHLSLNAGLPVINPSGGLYFVFLAGTPMFRKYDAAGRLLFERHIEGPELDTYIQSLPTKWPGRDGSQAGTFPVIAPAVRAAAADRDGHLWISLNAPVTYVYDAQGEKRRTVQFRGAGLIEPQSLSFAPTGRLLITPGCYAYEGF